VLGASTEVVPMHDRQMPRRPPQQTSRVVVGLMLSRGTLRRIAGGPGLRRRRCVNRAVSGYRSTAHCRKPPPVRASGRAGHYVPGDPPAPSSAVAAAAPSWLATRSAKPASASPRSDDPCWLAGGRVSSVTTVQELLRGLTPQQL
jgi:hypothetical protein